MSLIKLQPHEREEVRSVLNTLDAVLAKQGRVANAVWSVLTALRGPDYKDGFAGFYAAEGVKARTTSPLRTAAFPVTDQFNSMSLAIFAPVEQFDPQPTQSEHFDQHIREAANVLKQIGRLP